MNSDSNRCIITLRRGFNLETPLVDSDKPVEKQKEQTISDSQFKEMDTVIEQQQPDQQQNTPQPTNNNEDNRNVIRFEPEEDQKNNPGDDLDDILPDQPSEETAPSTVQSTAQIEKIIVDIKELDSKIKENQDIITNLGEKVGSISEDMNELLGLYEIMTGQMNPFVGLSNVTKKRLDTLENFDTEIDSLKTRLEKLEALFGKINLDEVDHFQDITSMSNIDEIILRALEFVLEKDKVDDIIDEALQNVIMSSGVPVGMGG